MAGRPLHTSIMILVIVAVVLATAIGTVYAVGHYFPRQIAVLAKGGFTLDVPLMIIATAPNVTWGEVHSVAVLGFASTRTEGSSTFRFAWSLAVPAHLPVTFATTIPAAKSSSEIPLAGGGFGFLPAGVCADPCESRSITIGTHGPGQPAVYGFRESYNYTVRLMSRLDGFGSTEFLEIDLSPTAGSSGGTGRPGDFGTSLPGPEDLVPVEGFHVDSGPQVVFSTNGSAFQGRAFENRAGVAAIDAGTWGPLTIALTSSFRWSPQDYESVSFSGTGASFTVNESMDLRFGSIQVALEPWSGP